MTRNIRLWAHSALIVAVPAWLMAAPASGQDPKGGGGAVRSSGASSGGGSAAPSGGSSSGAGSSTPASGGGSSGGGTRSGGGGAYSGGGDRHAATGGSGMSVSRGGDRGSYSGGSRSGSAPRAAAPAGPSGSGNGASGSTVSTGSSGSTPPNGAGGNSTGRAVPRGDPGANTPGGVGVPPYARPRGNAPIVGTAVPRGSVAGAGGPVVVTGGYGFYPWWIGGAGVGGYYGGYYGPGYGGYYDPWYGGDPDPYQPQAGASQSYQDEGAVRLKIKPREAEVYVDGYFVGTVDDFDGVFQRLHVETGPHHIEVRAPGYETLSFDLRVAPGKTTTYTGELKRVQ